jgi:hypothetical protein
MKLTTTQLAALTFARVCEYESIIKCLTGEPAKHRTLHYQRFMREVKNAHKRHSINDLLCSERRILSDAELCADAKRKAKLLSNARLLRTYTESFARPMHPFAFEAPGLRNGFESVIEGMTIRYKPQLGLLSKGLNLTYVHLFTDVTIDKSKVSMQLRLIAEVLKMNVPNFHPNQLEGYMCHSGIKVKAKFLSALDRHRLQAIERYFKALGHI